MLREPIRILDLSENILRKELDISYNNLTSLNISLLSKTLSNLEEFRAAGNHIDNGLGIIHSLGSNLWVLDFSQNIIGTLNRSTFERFGHLYRLNLSDTHLEHFDVNPLKVFSLDISRNKLKRLNVNLLSHTLRKLKYFYAADNDFENTTEIIQNMGSNLGYLDLSGNYVGKLNETTFEQAQNISRLWLRRTNLSISDVKPFETMRLAYLDISKNNLKKLNFSTSIVFRTLEGINLSENHLTQLDGLKHSYPKLTKLDITNNDLKCTYLFMFRIAWDRLEIIGDPCTEIENNETQSQTDTESSTLLIYGSFALVICLISCALDVYCFRKRRKSAGSTNFETGDVNGLNPECPLDVQADLLPYDRKYEFPRNKLKLGKQLGAGAFGIVSKRWHRESLM
ncbi:leucine-rich repeat-containing protein 7-like, partial [Sitodiplosis mosellana]|uniref:leucine-rich repeat-containing protein 7-like n=1 Tax=Sitodiplosis mosellana TaxID=263140 RepID=UPI0024451F23